MATPADQLSLKNQMPSNLPAASAPEGFSTAQYAMPSFDNPYPSPDNTIPKSVPAMPAEKLKEEEDDKKGEKLDEMEFDIDLNSLEDDDWMGEEADKDADKKVDEAADDKDGDKLSEDDDKPWDKDKKVDEAEDKDGDKLSEEADKDDDKKVDEAEDKDGDKLDEADDKDGDKLDEADDKKDLDEGITFPKIRMRISLAEEAAGLLAEDKTLTEEQKRQARSLFESTVKLAAKSIAGQMNRVYRKTFAEQKALVEQKLVQQVDAYLTYVAEQWASDNKVALKNNVRVELAEDFMAGLKAVFTESYVTVPESKVDLVKQLQEQVTTLTEKVNASEAAASKLHARARAEVDDRNKALIKEHKLRLIAEACVGLPETERAKVVTRAKELPFTKSANFRSDVAVLIESVTGRKDAPAKPASDIPAEAGLLSEQKSGEAQPNNGTAAYMQAVDRTVGKR